MRENILIIKIMDLNIEQEFKSVIPSLAPEEFAGLESSIISEGLRDALVVWNGIILDGNNRYEICKKHGIEFKTIEKEFKSVEDAKEWIIRNQFSRRNLSVYDRSVLALKLKDLIAAKAKARMMAGKEDPDQNSEQGRTVKKIAKIAGVSHDTIFKVEKIDEKAPAEIKQKIKDGKLTINKAYNCIKLQEIRKQREEIAKKGKDIACDKRWNMACADINTYQTIKKYDFIITDPPYSRQYLPLYDLLGKRAKQWLKDSGLLVVMCGQSYLNEIIKILDLHLNYYWTACYLTCGQPTPLRQRQVNSTCKPILIYTKNCSYKGKIFGDVFKSDANDKNFHKWGQSVIGMCSIISQICLPGQTILDPFAGSGTTGIAALKHGCLFDGIDILQENVDISKARLNDKVFFKTKEPMVLNDKYIIKT